MAINAEVILSIESKRAPKKFCRTTAFFSGRLRVEIPNIVAMNAIPNTLFSIKGSIKFDGIIFVRKEM